MAAIAICSDFGTPKNKVWHCFHCFLIYLLWSDGTRCHDLSLGGPISQREEKHNSLSPTFTRLYHLQHSPIHEQHCEAVNLGTSTSLKGWEFKKNRFWIYWGGLDFRWDFRNAMHWEQEKLEMQKPQQGLKLTQFMIRLRWSIFTLIVCQKENHHGETYISLRFFPYPISDIKFLKVIGHIGNKMKWLNAKRKNRKHEMTHRRSKLWSLQTQNEK